MMLRQKGRRLAAVILTAATAVTAMGGCRSVKTGGAPSLPVQPESLLIVGDSIAEGYMDKTNGETGVDSEACFGALLKKAWNLPDDGYHNNAVSGWTTEDLVNRLDDVTKGVGEPQVIAVSAGGNDVLRPLLRDAELMVTLAGLITGTDGQGPHSVWDSVAEKAKELSGKAAYTAAVDGMKQNLDAVLQSLTRLFPDSFIVVQTLYNPLDRSESLSVAIPLIDKVNAALRETAAKYDRVRILDVAAAFAGHGAVYLSSDFIHPNRTGHERLAGLYEEWWHSETAEASR